MAKERTQQQREALLQARAEHASDRARRVVDALAERAEFLTALQQLTGRAHGLRDILRLKPQLLVVAL